MRVHLEILSPGMQDTEEADIRAEVPWIGRNLEECGGAGVKQKVIHEFLVVECQPRQFVRNREDHMYVLHRQQFFFTGCEPSLAGVGLALGTMPRAAGVKRNGLIAALMAPVQVATERCRAAMLDGEEDAEMLPRQPGTVPVDEAIAMRANDVGHLEGWRFHLLFGLRERFT